MSLSVMMAGVGIILTKAAIDMVKVMLSSKAVSLAVIWLLIISQKTVLIHWYIPS